MREVLPHFCGFGEERWTLPLRYHQCWGRLVCSDMSSPPPPAQAHRQRLWRSAASAPVLLSADAKEMQL